MIETRDDGELADKTVVKVGLEGRKVNRRRVIVGSAVLGIGAMGVCFQKKLGSAVKYLLTRGNQNSPDASEQKSSAKPAPPILNTAAVKAYRKFLEQHPNQYLSPNEVLRPHFKTRGGVASGVPPEYLWGNMLAPLRVADEIRRRLGVPLHNVISAYRSPQYNAKCPGASKYSQHMKNCALDLVYACPPQRAFDTAEELRKEGFFKGGIGLYSNFIHIDTRGRNATWGQGSYTRES